MGRRGSYNPGNVVPTPASYPTAAPQSQPQPTPQRSVGTYTPQPVTQQSPSPVAKPSQQCVSNHPTIDYSLSCKALFATCEQHSFCRLASVGENIRTPTAPTGTCVS